MVDVSLEVLTPTCWIDTTENPPLIFPTWSLECTRHVLVNSLGGLVCTLGEGETFRIKIVPLAGPICCRTHVDGNPTFPGDSFVSFSSPNYVSGYTGLDNTIKPFTLSPIDLVNSDSLRAATVAQDAMSRAGKIEITVHEMTIGGEVQTYSVQSAASSSSLETTAKKALLNGLSTAPPTSSGGTYTFSSSGRRGAALGEITIAFRDRSAILLWLDKDEEGGAGGGGAGGGAGSKRQSGGGAGVDGASKKAPDVIPRAAVPRALKVSGFFRGSARATRRTRRRGGLWARRAAERAPLLDTRSAALAPAHRDGGARACDEDAEPPLSRCTTTSSPRSASPCGRTSWPCCGSGRSAGEDL